LLNVQASTPAIPRRLLWTWLALLALSQLADLATTWGSLAVGLREDNPIVAAALHSGSFPLFALVKVALVVALGIVLLGGRPIALTGARLVVLTFSVIAIGNLISVLASQTF
jgi:hypothetical protein